ncbi:8-amino-7-oxononanoate synthase [Methylococcaceae bacterium HT4]|nr:8-amino-7-oxononanoate synthase [Methylococcaceae bacterium CS4]TXK99842.1 8-amino-7-oxononanoate synthase [Methylococcaceae bacterium CS5]TXL06468.1 8-amino-7-oxononanoate synthase [Methylococcaceae bacterium CS1]TXL07228.1 8-amino-7-oxononanoate synthase [Methylococcaceae bacterium CS3]TXL10866.1 8-amino-7-oxononanoate synthase [Methylococcaceae bacterium CS2]TXL14430.1 8-amino-7-oxononanoate synthase [Methylococcaceae bacterium HT4]TXL20420.1 8-amino-7-oxononanoate synthase [Methylococc
MSFMVKQNNLLATLDELKQANLYRTRRIIDSAQGVYLRVDGRKLLNFCSNDYLGLANHPQVIESFKQAVDKYGVGSGSAHLVCGHGYEHHALEEELADFTGRERVLLFSTGYMANLGVIAALMGKGGVVYEDKLNHASLLDGGLLSGAKFKRYLHNDMHNLQAKMHGLMPDQQAMIVTDGVFSMDGDYAPLEALSELAQQQGAYLMVDDAHGFGVLGATGAGLVEQCQLNQQQVPVLVGTLGKAFGTSGAFVAGSEVIIETLIQKARTYIYTTALPPAIAAATRTSLQFVINDSWRRDKLKMLVQRFQTGARQIGLDLMPSESAIQPIVLGNSLQALQASEHLLQQGLWVSAIRPPTVPEGSARLRITFSAQHTEQHIDQLLCALEGLPA